MSEYYIIRSNSPAGPFTIKELAAMAITPDTMVWMEGEADWRPAGSVGELQSLFATSTGQEPPLYESPSYGGPQPLASSAVWQREKTFERPPKPRTYLAWSIVVALLFSRIIGIIALVYSVQVSSCYYAGNYEGAAYASRQARRWVRVPAYIFLVLLLAFLIEELIRWIVGA